MAQQKPKRASWASAATYSLWALTAFLICRHFFKAYEHGQFDLTIYRMGAQAFLDRHDIYTINIPLHTLPFTYPPLAALIFVPLALIKTDAAQLVWTFLSIAALLVIVITSYQYATGKRFRDSRWAGPAAISGALALEPVIATLNFGQINLVIAALVIRDLFISSKPTVGGKPLQPLGHIPCGIFIGLATAIKLVPALFIVYLAMARQWRAAFTAAASFVTFTAFSAALMPSEFWNYWTKLMFDPQRIGGPAYCANQSLYGVVVRLSGGVNHVTALYPLLAVAILATGIGLATWFRRRGHSMVGDLTCAFSALLLSPISWSHHWVWCVPLIVWLALATDAPRFGKVWASVVAALFVASPIWWPPHDHNRELNDHGWQLLAGNSYFIGAIALIAAAIMLARQYRSAGSRYVEP